MTTHDKPLSAPPFDSYRYRGRYGFIMISARDAAEGLIEAQRSTAAHVIIDHLEKWNGVRYALVGTS